MIVIVTAMDKEYDLISEWIAKNWLDYKNVQNIALIKSGIGKVNAASCLTEFLSSNTSSKVTRVISVGCAGAAVAGAAGDQGQPQGLRWLGQGVIIRAESGSSDESA